jgi:hypothetical protein
LQYDVSIDLDVQVPRDLNLKNSELNFDNVATVFEIVAVLNMTVVKNH